jgi:hypothetical protein
LAEDSAEAHNLVRRIVRMGMSPIITQTVVSELGHLAGHGETKRKRKMAIVALSTSRSWGIQPIALKPVGNGICEVAANIIAARGLLPDEERNDAFILIEAAFCGVVMLVTWDSHLLGASNEGLNEVLKSFDLYPVQIAHPRVILNVGD